MRHNSVFVIYMFFCIFSIQKGEASKMWSKEQMKCKQFNYLSFFFGRLELVTGFETADKCWCRSTTQHTRMKRVAAGIGQMHVSQLN